MTNSQPQPTPTIADEIRDFIVRYVALPEEAHADILALYVLHTWAFDTAKTTPYIYLNSAEKQSGKTRTLEVLQVLAHNADLVANLSSATMFRVIEARRPTLLIDEVDAIWSGAKNEELRGLLNSGYKHNGSVWRAVGNPNDEDGGVKSFSTFCPKILAGIDNGLIPDTVMDRSITITLRRKRNDQPVADFYIEDVEEEAAELIERIQLWVQANRDAIADRANRPAKLESLSDRQNDILRPLLTIADRVHGWHDRARSAALITLGGTSERMSPQTSALLAVRDWFRETGADRISSAQAAEVTGHTGKQLAVWFSAYSVSSFTGSGRTFGQPETKNVKGYRASDFADAFVRYLPADNGKEV